MLNLRPTTNAARTTLEIYVLAILVVVGRFYFHVRPTIRTKTQRTRDLFLLACNAANSGSKPTKVI